MAAPVASVDKTSNIFGLAVPVNNVAGSLNLRQFFNPSSNITRINQHEFEWNPICTTSHKLDVYPKDVRTDSKKGTEPSFVEFSVDLAEISPTMHLEIFNCAREDAGNGFFIVEINGHKEILRAYQEDDLLISPELVEKNDGKSKDHLGLSQIDIAKFVKTGLNTIKISLHPETESGISIRWVEVVRQPTYLSEPPKFLPVPDSLKSKV